MAEKHSHNFATLDMLRGIAAFAVLVGHCREWLNPFVYGLFAVDLFFVMSGFVIAHAYERKLASNLSALEFLAIRIIRLYPLYIGGAALGIVFLAANHAYSLVKLIEISLFSVFMLPTPGPMADLIYPANPVAWSLFFEICINFLYALTFKRWTTRALIVGSAISFIFLIACRIYLHNFDFGWSWGNVVGGLARVSYGFPMGVLLYRLWSGGHLTIKAPAPLVIGATIVLLTPFPIAGGLTASAVGIAALAAAIPAVAALAINSEPSPGWRPTFLLFGRISYPIYALQLPILWISASLFGHTYIVGVLTIILVVLIAWVADKMYDAPLRAALTRRLYRQEGFNNYIASDTSRIVPLPQPKEHVSIDDS